MQGLEVKVLGAQELALRNGPKDRLAYLAARGFTVVDDGDGALAQLQEVYSRPPSRRTPGEAMNKPTPQKQAAAAANVVAGGRRIMVGIQAGMRGKTIGHVIVQSGMSEHDKERMVLEYAQREANYYVRNGTNVAQVNFCEKAIYVRLKSAAGLEF